LSLNFSEHVASRVRWLSRYSVQCIKLSIIINLRTDS
jgi:hypothetical protein